jgi:hypothetical protein
MLDDSADVMRLSLCPFTLDQTQVHRPIHGQRQRVQHVPEEKKSRLVGNDVA